MLVPWILLGLLRMCPLVVVLEFVVVPFRFAGFERLRLGVTCC